MLVEVQAISEHTQGIISIHGHSQVSRLTTESLTALLGLIRLSGRHHLALIPSMGFSLPGRSNQPALSPSKEDIFDQ